MLFRIVDHDFEFKNVKGKDLIISDSLSRSQTTNRKRNKMEHVIELTRQVNEDPNVLSHLGEIAEETA